jgi:hypothetical protein
MNISLNNKTDFVSKFLLPISRVNDLVTVKVSGNEVFSLNRTADNNTILYASCNDIKCGIDCNVNVPDIKKLIKALDGINDNQVDLTINSNNLEYKSSTIKFKFHLLEDGIIAVPNLNINKINNFQYNVRFKMTTASLNTLLKSSTFITDSNKIYIFSEGDTVYGELTDRSKHNIDMYTTFLTTAYDGEAIDKPIPFTFDTFRLLSTLKSNVFDVSLNTERGILAIDIVENGYKLKYISTSMVC